VIGVWINDAVMSYGAPLVEDPSRYGYVNALGLDETLFYRKGSYHNQNWCTTILDTEDATLLDVVPDKDTKKPKKWIANQPKDWRDRVTLEPLTWLVPIGRSFERHYPMLSWWPIHFIWSRCAMRRHGFLR